MKSKNFFFIFSIFIFSIRGVLAHCPLCTIGAGAAAGAAVWLGVSKIVVALFIGAFAMSMGMWFSRIIKKRYIPFQKTIIVTVVFLTTVLPLLPIFSAIGPLYLSFIGEYGTTYAVDYSLGAGFLGGAVVLISPRVSRRVTKSRGGKTIPFQGVLITLLSLVILGGIVQLILK